MAFRDMFTFLKRCMEPFLEKVTKLLLRKASDTNVFISDEGDKAIEAMVRNCQETKIFCVLLAHAPIKAIVMRVKVCKAFVVLTNSLGNNILFFKDADKLLPQLAQYLSDAS